MKARTKKVSAAVLLFVVALMFGSYANAEENFTLSQKVWSKYVDTTGLVLHKEPVLQTDLFVSLPKGFYIDLWHSVGLGDDSNFSSNAGDELNIMLGWSGKAAELQLDAGIIYLDLVDLLSFRRGDIVKTFVEVSKSFELSKEHSLSPYVRFEFVMPARSGEFEKGTLTMFGFKHDWRITSKLALSHKAGLLYDDGALGLQKGVIGQYGMDLNWQISDSATISFPSIKVSGPLSDISDGRREEFVIGTGFAFRF